jgi:hypothetical protein
VIAASKGNLPRRWRCRKPHHDGGDVVVRPLSDSALDQPIGDLCRSPTPTCEFRELLVRESVVEAVRAQNEHVTVHTLDGDRVPYDSRANA